MVWLGNNLPYTGGVNFQTNKYGASALSDLQGFIWIKNDVQSLSSPNAQYFIQKWKSNNVINASK
jgi:hypothetical protein